MAASVISVPDSQCPQEIQYWPVQGRGRREGGRSEVGGWEGGRGGWGGGGGLYMKTSHWCKRKKEKEKPSYYKKRDNESQL